LVHDIVALKEVEVLEAEAVDTVEKAMKQVLKVEAVETAGMATGYRRWRLRLLLL
jgi:transcriptional antiterminator Rof (Rho-off)